MILFELRFDIQGKKKKTKLLIEENRFIILFIF